MTIVYILAAILIFGVLIAVHEFGHFAAAKLCGVRVNEFSIGMGPLIWHKETGETQYSFRLLPIGGFCAMEGEDEESGDERSLGRPGLFQEGGDLRRRILHEPPGGVPHHSGGVQRRGGVPDPGCRRYGAGV